MFNNGVQLRHIYCCATLINWLLTKTCNGLEVELPSQLSLPSQVRVILPDVCKQNVKINKLQCRYI